MIAVIVSGLGVIAMVIAGFRVVAMVVTGLGVIAVIVAGFGMVAMVVPGLGMGTATAAVAGAVAAVATAVTAVAAAMAATAATATAAPTVAAAIAAAAATTAVTATAATAATATVTATAAAAATTVAASASAATATAFPRLGAGKRRKIVGQPGMSRYQCASNGKDQQAFFQLHGSLSIGLGGTRPDPGLTCSGSTGGLRKERPVITEHARKAIAPTGRRAARRFHWLACCSAGFAGAAGGIGLSR